MIKTYISKLTVLTLFIVCCSCEQERLEAELATAPGGGTLTTFTAYAIESTDPLGSNVYGRVVFWKTNLNQTLVQVSLYNTFPDEFHPALIAEGTTGTTKPAMMLDLDAISGETGQLSTGKFLLISDTGYYDSIATMDAHINIYRSASDDTVVATGNLGVNANPVDSN